MAKQILGSSMLTASSQRIEKQIKGIQDKSETVKTNVSQSNFQIRELCADADEDYPNPILRTAGKCVRKDARVRKFN